MSNTNENIIKTEHLVKMITEKISDVVWLMDMTGKNTFVTPSIKQFTGYDVAEFLQQTLDDRLTKESAIKAKQAFNDGLNTFHNNPDESNMKWLTLELEYLCKDGNTKWGEVLITPYIIESKKSFGVLGVIRDISNHKKIETELNKKNIILTKINDFLKELTFQPTNKIEHFIINKLKEFSNAKAVFINMYHNETSELICTDTTLSDKESSTIIRILGKSIIGFRSPVSNEMYKEIITQQIGNRQSLNEITFGAVPKVIGNIIQKILGITWLTGIALLRDQQLVGTLMIIGDKDSVIPDNDFLIAISGITANALERKKAEKALTKSEQLYRLITEKITDIVWLMDLEGNSIFVSPSIEQFTGFTPAEYLLQTIDTRFTKESALKAKQTFSQELQYYKKRPESLKKYRISLMLEYLCKNGDTKWGELLITPYFNENNNLAGVHGVTRDITQRNQSEKALKESEEKYRNLVETTNDIIWETNIQGLYTYINPQVEKILGYKQEEITGRSPFDFMTPDDAIKIKKRSDEIIASKKPFNGLININLHKAGYQVIFETSGVPVLDNNNNLIGYRGIDRNITERQLAADALLESQQIIEGIINAIYVRVFWKDKNLVYLGCNTAFAIDAGFSTPKDIIGKDDYQMGWRNQAELYRSDDLQVIESSNSKLNIEEPSTTPEGNTIILLTNKIPLLNSKGEVYGVLGTYINITERKKAEEELVKAKKQAEKSERLKSAFLANMSHEIRTPMNSLIGYSDFLSDSNISESDQKEYAAIIHKNSHRLLHLINSIMDISKIEAGEMQIQFGSFNVNKLIKDLYDLNRNLAKNKNINFNHSLGLADEKAMIKSSEIPIFQILSNFLSNAFKYTSKGEISFGYTLRHTSTGSVAEDQSSVAEDQSSVAEDQSLVVGVELEFFVKDTGTGISKEYLPKIFGRFSQENPMLSRKHEGAGLGLSIAKGFADLLYGSIYIESEQGKGSTFYFKIPFEKGDSQETNENTDIPNKNNIDLTQAKILIVEDDEGSFKLLKKQILRETLVNILHATDGYIALDYVRSEKEITCILMDLHLPVMDGFTTTRNIKQINKKIPVIAVTAAVMTIDQENALEAGCDAFFSKPIDIKKLISLIAKYYNDK